MQFEITPEFLASQGLSPTFPQRFWAKVDKNGPIPAHRPELGPCWVWTGYKQGPKHLGQYGKIWRSTRTDTFMLAHVASWILHNGPKLESLCVLHLCDTPSCVNPAHLVLGTKLDNSRDCIAKGRALVLKGEKVGTCKLTQEQVEDIRKRYVAGTKYINGPNSGVALAREFGVCPSAIYLIVKGKNWKHLNKQTPDCKEIAPPAPRASICP